MSPAIKPMAASIESLGLPKQDISNLSEEDKKLFFQDKQNNIIPYYKEDIYNFINVYKPCTFFPILKAVDVPFYEEKWLSLIKNQILYQKDIRYVLGKYIAWCKLFDNKDRKFEDSNKFFTDWLTGSDYNNFEYIPKIRFEITYGND